MTVRRFDADYLRFTRRGLWDDRSVLAELDLPNRRRVLDVGCGTGELTRVLADETPGEVLGIDADPELLAGARDRAASGSPFRVAVGDAGRLPVRTGGVDLVACQTLLINLPDPAPVLGEFRRVSSELVAAIEPDNASVAVDSTVEAEVRVERRARAAYLAGVETDVGLGPAEDLFRAAGLVDVRTRRRDHVRTVEPPYSEQDLRAARRKASGAGLASDRDTMLAGGMTERAYDDLRAEWRAMGRDVIAAIQNDEYRREETVPFYVTVGRVPDAG